MNINEIVSYYTGEFKKSIENNCSINESKRLAKEKMNSKFPETKEMGFKDNYFWSRFGNAIQSVLREIEVSEINDIDTDDEQSKRKTFFDMVRDAAGNGFIANKKLLEPFIGIEKASQLSAYVCMMRKNEGWKDEPNSYGWKMTRKINRRDEIKEQLADIKNQIVISVSQDGDVEDLVKKYNKLQGELLNA
jgi:hypothetical protein